MSRLIDANEILKSEHQHYNYMSDEYYVFVRDIENAPTVDPVRHGHWINKGYYAICSECGANSGTQYNGLEPIPRWSRYCPDCGAKMYEVEE